jgi:hypothetical protein
VPVETWLQNFLIWNLIFTIVPMIQFAILNASYISQEWRKKQIEDLNNEILAFASRSLTPDEHDENLQEKRKKKAREVRATITGGDVL